MTIPHPDNPFHIENLQTVPLLEAQGFEGADASLAISLFEYDCIWRVVPTALRDHQNEDYMFVFLVESRRHSEPPKFGRIDMMSGSFASDFSWIKPDDWDSMMSTHGTTKEEWMELPYPTRVYDLLRYWGFMNVFGSTIYGAGFEIRDPDHEYGSQPMPGESPDEYYERLVGGDESSGGEPYIPQDFVRTESGAWFGSPGFGNWMCHWHSGMDRVYAVGSSVIANHEVPLEVIEDAIALMERNRLDKVARGEFHDAIEAMVLTDVMKAALAAKPSEEPQQADP